MQFLRQNTATTIVIGPLISYSNTAVTVDSATFTGGQLNIFKANTTGIPLSSATRSIGAQGGGIYNVGLLASDLDTAGPLRIAAYGVNIPYTETYNVLAPAVYDGLFGSSGLPGNILAIGGDNVAAARLADAANTMLRITVGVGSSAGRIVTDLSSSITGAYNGRTLVFKTGSLAGQAATITSYNGATRELMVSLFTGAPSSGDLAVIV